LLYLTFCHFTILNSEPQLIAEAIAQAQINLKETSKKRSVETAFSQGDNSNTLDTIFGVRLHGLCFYFYIIPISSSILEAMKASQPASSQTTVRRLVQGGNKMAKFDWMVKEERDVIITVLYAVSNCLHQRGMTAISYRLLQL
jgi:hypothetical protein